MEGVGLITRLRGRGIRLSRDGSKVWAEPASKLTDDDRQAIRKLKPELIRLLHTDTRGYTPIVPLKQIQEIVDAFDAKYLGVKPKGWLPGRGENM
jgi:hypothetical protein